jgi:hypothetical protein
MMILKMSQIQYLKSFKDQMVTFLDELIEKFYDEPAFILIRIFVKDKIPVDAVLGRFMKECLQYKSLVDCRNDKLFTDSGFLCRTYGDSLGQEHIDKFKDIWINPKYLDKDDRKIIWEWMDLFFKLSYNYYKKFGAVEEWEFDLEQQIKNLKL